jgi:hypothetical protein
VLKKFLELKLIAAVIRWFKNRNSPPPSQGEKV